MNPLALSAIAGLAAVLVATLVLHYHAPRPEDEILPPSAAIAGPAPATPNPNRLATQSSVDTILARPLFTPSRRPSANSVQPGAANTLPRLTAVLVGNGTSSVIFAGEGAAKPVTLSEGGRIGQYRVRSIAAGQVTLEGPTGLLTLHPTPTPGSAAPASQPSMLDLMNRNNPNGLILPPPPIAAPGAR